MTFCPTKFVVGFFISSLTLSLLCISAFAFAPNRLPPSPPLFQFHSHRVTTTLSLSNNNKKEEWSDFAELPPEPDEKNSSSSSTPKLGIDLELDPLTPQEAMELRAEATELINESIARGMDDIAQLREKLSEEMLESKKTMELLSERRTKLESDKLLARIDSLTDKFLDDTQAQRKSTKLAAAADRNMEGRGVDWGSWGTVGGGAVVMEEGGGSSMALLGSVEAAKQQQQTAVAKGEGDEPESTGEPSKSNKILIIADESQDPVAKKILPPFSDLLQQAIPGVDVQTLKPVATMPLGGDQAACVLVFCTSLSDRSTLKSMYDRLLRRTLLPSGSMARPPTQLVCVSTLGTERTNKFPYSMQNMMMGGKLDQRRQMEEVVLNTVRQRVVEPPLDYTILKFGELQESSSKNNPFSLLPGDVLDGTTSIATAANVLLQAVAFQPAARNATLCAIGDLPDDNVGDELWNDVFLKLDGPELMRLEDGLGDASKYGQLVEYIGEWGLLMESGKKGLTTPIRVEPSRSPHNLEYEGVKERGGVRLLFLPTKTGSAYMSRDEERARERERSNVGMATSSTTATTTKTTSKKKEGGVEVLVEITSKDALRVRARRCNMADDTVVKELSEEAILKQLEKSIDVWKKQI